MGLDTRAYRPATQEWKESWVVRTNEQGWRPVMYGFMREPIGQVNYGLKGGYAGGREPFTIEDAPNYHQDDLEDIQWPGGLVGGMISSNGEGPSFRGKAYDGYVERVTGHSLYDACEEMWQGDDLEQITQRLELAADGIAQTPDLSDVEAPERRALAAWFRVCADNGLVVSGDY